MILNFRQKNIDNKTHASLKLSSREFCLLMCCMAGKKNEILFAEEETFEIEIPLDVSNLYLFTHKFPELFLFTS